MATAENVSEQTKQREWLRAMQIGEAVSNCKKLFACGVFSDGGAGSPMFEPAVVFLLINLNDLLQKADDSGHRVTFNDYIGASAGINDVTTLVNKCRNAACHIGSSESNIDTNVFKFTVVVGEVPNAMRIGEHIYGCDFADDIAIFYGKNRLYLRRHAQRALDEVVENLAKAGLIKP
ncbi:hypothetical protein [Paraburkholderia xenovorans]